MPSSENQLREKILQALQHVIDPNIKRNIISLGYVKELSVGPGSVKFNLELMTPSGPLKEQMKQACEEVLQNIPELKHIEINVSTKLPTTAQPAKSAVLPDVNHVIAIASGKGGVGKSTVSSNVALALAKLGSQVGLLDCDIYGPSIHMMYGLQGQKPPMQNEQTIMPLENYGVKVLSMGMLADDTKPVIWRGPMVHNIIQQFLKNVAWGNLDYLIIDMPPGTGDAQLSLSQESALSGAVIVTTPQDVSLIDATKGLKMFEQVNVPVIGIVENMSYFECDCGKRVEIFKHGGGKKISKELNLPFLGAVPLDPNIVQGGDGGKPVVESHPQAPSTLALMDVAKNIIENVGSTNQNQQPSNLNLSWN